MPALLLAGRSSFAEAAPGDVGGKAFDCDSGFDLADIAFMDGELGGWSAAERFWSWEDAPVLGCWAGPTGAGGRGLISRHGSAGVTSPTDTR
jgi:hypothetical protein